jgi:hypothetical protein
MLAAETLYRLVPKRYLPKVQSFIVSNIAKNQQKVHNYMNFVDINVVDHCNLNCKYCANFCALADEHYLDVESYTKDIEQLARISTGQVKTIRLLGGEPLLHPKLVEVIDITRGAFPQAEIDLVTNGILLPKMPVKFWQTCSADSVLVAISHYPIKLNWSKIKNLGNHYKVKVNYGKKPRGMYKWLLDVDGEQDITQSFKYCIRANTCAVLADGKLYACSVPPWIKYFNKAFHTDLKICNDDWRDIYQLQSLDDLNDFFGKPMPFCKYCRTPEITYNHAWGLSRKEINEWT